MRLEPGPIPQLPTDFEQSPAEEPDFEHFVRAWLAEADALEIPLDAWLDPSQVIDEVLPHDNVIDNMDYAGAVTQQMAFYVNQDQMNDLESQKTAGDAAIIDAYQSTPGEAFMEVPAGDDLSGPPPAPPAASAGVITLTNLSRPATMGFFEGDEYAIDVQLDTNAQKLVQYYQVSIESQQVKDDEAAPHFTFPKTDLNGRTGTRGVFQPGDAGNWWSQFVATTTDGIQDVIGTLSWVVQAAGAGDTTPGTKPPPAAVPLVSVMFVARLMNFPDVIYQGNPWHLDVYGPPLSDVTVTGTFNGQRLAPAVIGKTDVSGHYHLDGEVAANDVGTWVEYYSVGGFQWDGKLQFTAIAV
jgi:hypothetical protein